jgi:PAS domain S-box-containing protein
MGVPLKHPAEEIKRLQRCVSDLVSVLALPAMWTGSDPSQIVNTLLDALLGMLHLDVIYVQLKSPAGEAPIETVRVVPSLDPAVSPQDISRHFSHWSTDYPEKWPSVVPNPVGDGDLSVVPLQLGLHGEVGLIVAGSQRPDFPSETERLLLSVAANQAAIGLHGARLLSEQKRVASELDRRVAQRGTELAAANKDVQLQIDLLQLIPVAAWTLRPDGTPDFVSQNWLEYAGQPLEFVRSTPEAWMTAVHPDDLEETSRSFRDGIRLGQGFSMECRFRRAHDGTYRWHLNRAVPVRGVDGNILRFVGTSTDIEDLKQSQEDLLRAEEKTRLIIDTALDAVIAINSEGIVVSWNKQAEIVFGWSSKEAIGRRMSEMIIPEQQRPAHESGLRHFLATGDGPILRRRIEVTAIRRNGDEFPLELEVLPMKAGRDWFFSAFLRDITDSKLAQEKLRQSERNLRQLTETIPEMLWSATPEGAIDYCNSRVLEYTGLSPKEIMSGGWAKLLHPDDGEQATREWVSCVATGAPYRIEVRAFHAADHTYRWCVTSALPMLDQHGRSLRWHGTLVDMHDWKQAQEELRNTQAELAHATRVMTMGELTASVAHEIKQPMSAAVINAKTCLRWLERDQPDLTEAREAAARLVKDVMRASELIGRIGLLFKKGTLQRELVDVNEVIQEMIALLHAEASRHLVSIHRDFADDLPRIMADRVQLQQVLMNLIINGIESIKDTGGPGKVTISSKQEASRHLLVSVTDTGAGVRPEHVEHIFDAFFTSKPQGTGMGLAICRSIVESHSGRLWASPGPGSGATFQFTLPIETAAHQTA